MVAESLVELRNILLAKLLPHRLLFGSGSV
jgi:hypothetical protein